MSEGHIWRVDRHPRRVALAYAEANALGAMAEVAPGLFRSARPFSPGLAAYGIGGGRILAAGLPGPLPVPDGERWVHVVKGPWKTSGSPAELVARLGEGVLPGNRSSRLELYAAEDRWWLVEPASREPRFVAADLPHRTSSSLGAQVARAVVNLVCRAGDEVIDPVCGTGVLLVEAARLGCRVRGSDVNRKAVWWAGKNLAALGFEGALTVADALSPWEGEAADVLVGDLPYGRRLLSADLVALAKALPQRARRWALVADVDLSEAFRAAGHPPRQVVRVPKWTFDRFVHVGGGRPSACRGC